MDPLEYVILVVALFGVSLKLGECQSAANFMPTRPVMPQSLCFRRHKEHNRLIRYISDQQTKCMYWECTTSRIIPKPCGLQTYISEFYEADEYNPCTETYNDTTLQFDCTRKGFDPDGNPVCKRLYEDNGTCKNGATVKSQGNLCWCECTAGYTGFECSEVAVEPPTNVADSTTDASNSVETTDNLSNNPSEGATSSRPTNNNNSPSTNSGEDRPPENIVESSEDPDAVTSDTGQLALRRLRTRNRQRMEFRRRFLNRMGDDDDNTGPVVPDRPRRTGFSKTIRLDDASEPPARIIELAEEVVPPPAVNSRVDKDGRFSLGDPCPNGFQKDFCAEEGCLNGGTCVNQCLQAICLCRPPYTAGRRCEQYRCTDNIECMNGGTCMRGISGISPVATCTCIPGFAGPMCESNLAINN